MSMKTPREGFYYTLTVFIGLFPYSVMKNEKSSKLKPSIDGTAVLLELRDLVVNAESLFLVLFT
jgi:hypothetical protein